MQYNLLFLQSLLLTETINHILSSCVFSRTIWSLLFRRYRLPDVYPSPEDNGFFDWWMELMLYSPRK